MAALRLYANGTNIWTTGPWGLLVSARAVCPDGKVRAVKLSRCADTPFSVPARLSYRNTTVSGFVSFASDSGLSAGERQFAKFTPTGKHKDIWGTRP